MRKHFEGLGWSGKMPLCDQGICARAIVVSSRFAKNRIHGLPKTQFPSSNELKWKVAKVITLLKLNTDFSAPSSFCPNSLLSTVAKVMKTLLLSILLKRNELLDHRLPEVAQYGRSCSCSVLVTLDLTKAFNHTLKIPSPSTPCEKKIAQQNV